MKAVRDLTRIMSELQSEDFLKEKEKIQKIKPLIPNLNSNIGFIPFTLNLKLMKIPIP